MARHKDSDWCLPEPKVGTWEQASVAVLMDLRDELKEIKQALTSLNSLFQCRNFLNIPKKLDAIKLNTTRKKRKPNA